MGSGASKGTKEHLELQQLVQTLTRIFPESSQCSEVEVKLHEILHEDQEQDPESFHERLNLLVSELQSLDPWNFMDAQSQLKRLDADCLEQVLLSDLEDIEEQSMSRNADNPVCLTIDDNSALASIRCPSIQFRQCVMGLDLSTLDCSPTGGLRIEELNVNFIRYLDASGVSEMVLEPQTFKGLFNLIWLNLSFTAIDWQQICEPVFQPLSQRLLRLNLDGCDLDCVPVALVALASLCELTFTENLIESFDAMTTLAAMQSLKQVDFRENPISSIGNKELYFNNFQNLCPNLTRIDNRPIGDNSGAGINFKEIPGLMDAMTRTDTVMDHNEDRGSCSCIEGNPCQVEYTCKDWKHRFEIAKAALEQ